MQHKLFSILICNFIFLSFNNIYGQILWNSNQRNQGNQAIDIQNFKQEDLKFITPKTGKNSFALVNNYQKMSAKKDSINTIAFSYDSANKPASSLHAIDKNDFLKLAAIYAAKTDNLLKGTQLAKNTVDSFVTSNNNLNSQEKSANFTSFTNNLYKEGIGADSIKRADELKDIKLNWLRTTEFARNNGAQVKSFLEILNKGDTSATNQIKDLNSEKPVIKYISYIILSLQDSTIINPYFDSLNILGLTKDDSVEIRIKMDDINRTVSKLIKDQTHHIALFASGDFLSTAQSSSITSNNTILSGTLGVNYTYNNKNNLMLKLIFLSTQDTVINNYGPQLLVPAKGKGFGTVVAGYSHSFDSKSDDFQKWGLTVFASASTQHWRVDSSQLNNLDSINSKLDSTFNESASLFAVDLLVNRTISIKDSVPFGSNKYALSFAFNFGLAGRYLGGDVLNPLQNKSSILYNNGYYASRFPTTRKFFFGLETGASISLGPILAEFEAYYFPPSGKDKQPLSGLTGLQIAFGASINLNIWQH